MKKRWVVLSFLLNAIAIVILMMRSFYPYHVLVAFLVYVIGWIPFLWGFKEYKKKLTKKRIIVAIIFIGLFVIIWGVTRIFPIGSSNLIDNEILLQEKINEDRIFVENYVEKTREAERGLLNSIRGVSLDEASFEKKQDILDHWREYLGYLVALDVIVDDYKYFYQINYLKNRELNEQSFMLGYSAFIAELASSLKVVDSVREISFLEDFLNEERSNIDIPKEYYSMVKKEVADPANGLRAHAGFVYMQTIKQEKLSRLIDGAGKDYGEVLKFFGQKPVLGFEGAMETFEQNSFKAWFPMQKEVAEYMGDTKIPLRNSNLISLEDVENAKKVMEPGDLMVQRRDFYLSNAGLPGFWKHAALYVGNLSMLDEYFDEEFRKSGLADSKFSDYIAENFPQVYLELEDGKLRTIEAESEGIISFTIERSLACDYAAILRPKVEKKDKLLAMIYAFRQFGKPYDFNFDFMTDNSLVCSELFYKAYPILNYSLRPVSGRLVLSANDIAKDFDEAFGKRLDLVKFIDGELEGNLSGFRSSWKRSSW